MQAGASYRPDIDGLRAIAVLAVVLYHLGVVLPGSVLVRLSGGFVGVDVFFVISGYFITKVIQTQLDQGQFSVAAFYQRRALRILPALFVMLVIVSLFSIYYMFPVELTDYSYSLIANVGSISNFYFWNTASYFSTPGDTKPLLHTWSLAVEEQFYLFWPILLSVIHRRAGALKGPTIAILGILSFILGALGVYLWPDGAFYLVFGRIWELLLGAALALRLLPSPRRRWGRELTTVTGLSLILVSVFAYNETTLFPGVAALLPCLGAVLVIAGGEAGSSIAGQMLSFRPLVFVGLISYSLYLWHWPVMVMQKTMSLVPGGDIGRMVKLGVVGLCFALAALSWQFVERPFRYSSMSRANVLRLSAASGALLIIIGLLGLDGLPSRFPVDAVRMGGFLDYPLRHPGLDACQLNAGETASDAFFAGCLPSDATKPTVLLLGDSHATHLGYGLQPALSQVNLLRVTGAGCKPVLETDLATGHCGSLFSYLYRRVLPAHKVGMILLAGRWVDADLGPVSAFLNYARSRGIPVLLFGPIVQYDQALPRLIAESERLNEPGLIARHRLDNGTLDQALASVARANGADYVSLLHLMCPTAACLMVLPGGTPVQYDYGHLTIEGSQALVAALSRSGTLALINRIVRKAPAH